MIVTYRVRLNVRLPDVEKKYRDELTQEAEVSLEAVARCKALELRSSFYPEAHRLGAADYQE